MYNVLRIFHLHMVVMFLALFQSTPLNVIMLLLYLLIPYFKFNRLRIDEKLSNFL